ncbi:polyprotein [Pyrenophora tritici-repentis]|nr:polyprotein [Pyrenophora tritici-repentis]
MRKERDPDPAFDRQREHKRIRIDAPVSTTDLYEQYISTDRLHNEEAGCNEAIAYWLSRYDSQRDLARFALDMFAISPMSDECERLFSSAKLTIVDRRGRLKADIIEACECLRAWYGKPQAEGNSDIEDNQTRPDHSDHWRALRQQRSEGSVQSTDRRLSSQAQSRTQTPVRTRGRDVDSRQTRDQDQTHARVQGRQETVEEEQQIQDQLAKTIEKAQNQPIRSQPVETTESAPQPAYQRVQSQQPPLTYNNFDRFREYTPAYPQRPKGPSVPPIVPSELDTGTSDAAVLQIDSATINSIRSLS